MTTTRTARLARALAFLTMGALASVPVLRSLRGAGDAPSAQASTQAKGVADPAPFVPKHHRGMMPVRQPGATENRHGLGSSGLNHFAGDGGRGVDGKLEYFGGRVISNVKVYDIFWGAGPEPAIDGGTTVTDAGTVTSYQASIPGFYSTVLAGSYWTWLAEYNTAGLNGAANNQPGSNQIIGPGSFAGIIQITPSTAATTISAQQVGSEIAYQMGQGKIPPLDLDANGNVNSLYMVDFPGTITITDQGSTSCQDFCAEHQTMQMMVGSVTYSVPYAIMPSQYDGPCKTGGGCGTSTQTAFENTTEIASHELAESVTDTEIGLAFGLDAPIAWYDAVDQLQQGSMGGEIGDICDGIAGIAGGYAVQKLWSNLNNQCIDAAPLCNGTSQPPYCTPCAATDDGIGCFGATPTCETSATSAVTGQCVACTSASPCPNGPTAFCDLTNDTCHGCAASDCTGGNGVCETSGASKGLCVQCDATHTTACTAPTALCDTTTFTCVGCVTSATCSGATPICDSSAQVCRACAGPDDCQSGQVCSATSGQCGACKASADCANNPAGSVCKAGACVPGTVVAGSPDAGNGQMGNGVPDASVASGDASKDAATGSGSSGGCAVGGGASGDGALAWLAVMGLVVAGRRRRR
jgi:MYXO-CTERM domain-containing protein